MRYRDLGPTQQLLGVPDPQNPFGAGNYTITADPQALNCKVALAEVYQCNVNGPLGSSFNWARNRQLFNQTLQGWNNNYDPIQPMFIRPGDTVFFYWNVGAPMTPVPVAVMWLRYDIDLPENQAGQF